MGITTNRTIFRSGKIRGELTRFKDGVGGTIWVPFNEDDGDDGAGCCFDLAHEDIDDYATVINNMANADEKQIAVYEYDEHDEDMDKFHEEQKTWWYKFKWWLKDWGIHIMPFDWEFKIGKRTWYSMIDLGVSIGPLKITKGNWRT